MTIDSKHPVGTAEVDAALLSYIDEIVTAKITEKLKTAGQTSGDEQQADKAGTSNRATIVVFSSDMDKLLASFVIATGAASMGMRVSMYFAFWGLTALKKKTILKGKPVTEKLMAVMMPSGPNDVRTSKMNWFGMGPAFFRHVMRKKHISTLPEMIAAAKEMGVRMVACQMSMDVMGLKKEELLDGLDYGGVVTYLADARDSRITLFI